MQVLDNQPIKPTRHHYKWSWTPLGPIDPVGRKETWEERFHKIEEAMANELGMEKYRCPCKWCCGGGRFVLRATIRNYFWKHGRDPTRTKPIFI